MADYRGLDEAGLVRKYLATIWILLCCFAAYAAANFAPAAHVDKVIFDQRIPEKILLVGDEKMVVWYNKSGSDWYWWSLRADANMVTDANYVWPFAAGSAGDVLFIRQIEDTAEVYLDWGLFDANWVVVDGNEFTFPTRTPWRIMYADANEYPLCEDPNLLFYRPESAFGVGLNNIAVGTLPNNYIQVYTLLDFEPNLLNVTIGRGSDDTATGPNNVTIGNSAGDGLTVGQRNTLGGNFAGEAIATRDDDSFYGFESGKNVGGGALAAPLSDFKYAQIAENGAIWGVPLGDKTIETLDADNAVNVGGGIVGINYNNATESGNMRFVAGDVVRFSGTTNYDASAYTLTAGTTLTQLQFTDTYQAETFSGTEIVVRYLTATAGAGRTVQDSNGNLYIGHTWNAVNTTYVTKIQTDGTVVYNALNHSWGAVTSYTVTGIAITDDDLYLYVFLTRITGTDLIEKYNLSTGDLEWSTSGSYDGYDLAIDENGNAYAPNVFQNVYQFNSSTGVPTALTNTTGLYELVVDNDLSLIIAAGGGTGETLNLSTRILDDSTGASIALGGTISGGASTYRIGSGCVAYKDGYIYVLIYDPTCTIYKLDTDLNEIDSIAGPTDGQGLFFDLWGNLVVVNQDFTSPSKTDIFWYYDTNLNFVISLDGFYNQMFRTWDSPAGGIWISGSALFYPGLNEVTDSGNSNTAIGSQALRGADAGAEPNDATVGGYKAAYTVTTANAPTSWGAYSLGQITSGNEDIALGPYAGWPITTESDYIVFDSRKRTSIANMESQSIIVGKTADDPNNQWLSINVGELNLDFGRFDVNDVNVAGSVIMTGLTASRLVDTDASKNLASVTNLQDYIAGTADEITITDDGDGTVTIDIPDPLIVGKGGTGAATLTDHGILLGSGTAAVTALGAATNGQIPIGSTGADPVLAEITGTANQITSTPGAGTITLSTPQDIHTAADPTFAGMNLTNSADFASNAITFQPTADSTTFWRILQADGSVFMAGDTSNNILYLYNTAGTNYSQIFTDTQLRLRPSIAYVKVETLAANTDTEFAIEGNGTGRGVFKVYNKSDDGWVVYQPYTTRGYLSSGGTVTDLTFQASGGDVSVFTESAEGTTTDFKIYGYRTGDSLRSLEIGVGVDAADTASFDGLSNYWLLGNLKIGEGTTGTDYTITVDGETNDGVIKWMEDEDYFEFDDDLVFSGDAVGLPYGDMYTNTTIAVSISDNNPTEIKNATNDGFTAGEVHRVTFPTGGDEHYLSVDVAGRYRINWSISCAQNAPSAAIELEGGIMVGGVAQNPGRAHRTVSNSTDKGNMAGTCILDLAASAQVSLYVTNETNTTDIDVEHANLTLVHVGGT